MGASVEAVVVKETKSRCCVSYIGRKFFLIFLAYFIGENAKKNAKILYLVHTYLYWFHTTGTWPGTVYNIGSSTITRVPGMVLIKRGQGTAVPFTRNTVVLL